ncbi:FeoB-associated Cys-rich membrane protein [Weeksellaceae bacterium TAE3-ERU29]|nr:FeoB-associated Cys-rich membrane protein [Weeksellaceae bacterium TAE3-ERU29]
MNYEYIIIGIAFLLALWYLIRKLFGSFFNKKKGGKCGNDGGSCGCG